MTPETWFTVAAYPVETAGAVRVRCVIAAPAHDGDTIAVVRLARTGPRALVAESVRVRLAHIDTPELSGGTSETREAARAARDRLRSLLPVGAAVVLYDLGPDKYGRTLGQIDAPDGSGNVSVTLLREGLARPYGGGRR